MELVITLIVSAGLALIPANIAKNKGYSFGLWWFYGWMLFIVALIHSLLMKDKNEISVFNSETEKHNQFLQSSADELKKYKELYDMGVLTEEEFETKKKQILNL